MAMQPETLKGKKLIYVWFLTPERVNIGQVPAGSFNMGIVIL